MCVSYLPTSRLHLALFFFKAKINAEMREAADGNPERITCRFLKKVAGTLEYVSEVNL